MIEGDARQLDRFGLGAVDVCLTSPPYMTRFDHPQNPLTAYTTLDGDYETYLAELLDVFLAVSRHLRTDGYLVINAATIRSGDLVTPLAWDIVHMLRPHLDFQGETYLPGISRPPSSAVTTASSSEPCRGPRRRHTCRWCARTLMR